jgi:hypothetical protein
LRPGLGGQPVGRAPPGSPATANSDRIRPRPAAPSLARELCAESHFPAGPEGVHCPSLR